MIQHKVSIGAFIFHAENGDIFFLEKLLNTCDTSKLTLVRANCFSPLWKSHQRQDAYISHWVSAVYTCLENRRVIDLTGNEHWFTFQDMCKALGVPYSCSRPKLRQLHDTIALNCKNLSELKVNIDIPKKTKRENLRDHLSGAFFSSDRMYRLDLRFSVSSGISSVLEATLENLMNPEELSISCSRHSGHDRRIHLASRKLRSLNVSGLAKGNWISGDLPI
jgi:hypothetical protein